MKVMSIVGTRPELIKMSEIVKTLDKHVNHIFVHTGQNYDYELNEIFYKDLELRKPDHFLNWKGGSLAETVGHVMVGVEKLLKSEKPDAVVILGDTNSALAGIIVKRMKIPLFHLEAGNRCFDDNVPEEINRRILDHISDVNMVYTDAQRHYLIQEGVAKDRIFLMGSPMAEVIANANSHLDNTDILDRLNLRSVPYFLVNIHRDESTEIQKNLDILVDTLNTIAEKYESDIILSTHPRLQKKISDKKIIFNNRVRVMKPFGFFDYLNLQTYARCVLSDSGTIAEESAILGFPAITIRNAIERPEAIDHGSILMTGVDKENILLCLDAVKEPVMAPGDYFIENCSERVLKVILGYTGYVNRVVWRK